MQVILHFGTPKTGTTSIQDLFSRNYSLLLEKFGVCYPRQGKVGQAHHNIAYQFGGSHLKTKFQPIHKGLKEAIQEAEAKRVKACFISSEAFYHFQLQSLLELRQALLRYPITIIIYLRRQDAYLQSGYQQVCKFGNTKEAPWDFCQRKRALGNYDIYVSTLQRVFGINNIVVRRFEPPNKGFDACRDICALLMVNFETLQAVRPSLQGINASLGLKSLAFIHSAIVSSGVKPEHKFFKEVFSYFRTKGSDHYNFSLLNYTEAKSLYDAFAGSNLRLAKLVDPEAEATFFPNGPTESEYPGLPDELNLSQQDESFLKQLCRRHKLVYSHPSNPARIFRSCSK